MDEGLRATADALLAAAPASVEMPAGTGKTHLLAAAVAVAAERGMRSLVLTHTNAGVDAIRKRLKTFGLLTGMARVDTITSWAFSLVGAYASIAEIFVDDIPDWSQSEQYVQGALRVAVSNVIKDVHAVSFDYLFVDEYQDCTVTQHEFILAIEAAIPKTIVLGDPLQAIFGFAGALADWQTHVIPNFPSFVIAQEAHRWRGHNEDLGTWLLGVRASLVPGQVFDMSSYSVIGLSHVSDASAQSVATVAHGFRDFDESVVLLDKWPQSVAGHASRLGGSYSVMEDINGNFMRSQLSGSNPSDNQFALPAEGDPALALWFARFAKECVVGLANIDNTVLTRLAGNTSLSGLTRDGIQSVLDSFEALRVNPTYRQLAETASVIRSLRSLKIYRWEAWKDTLEAISITTENGESVLDNFGRVRERLRRVGRSSHNRIASRTLLVKGLEYDHIIIANLSEFTDPRNLYVALSRARKSVTVIGTSASIQLRNDT